MKFTK